MRPLESVLAGLKKASLMQRRFLAHLLGLLLMLPGRTTFRNLSRYSDYHEKTFSRWYARKVDWVSLNSQAIQAVVPATHEQVLAFDPSFVPKSGKRTYGLDQFWNSSHSRVEQGLEIGEVAWVDVTANTAYHLSAVQTPPLAVVQAPHNRIDGYLHQLRQVLNEPAARALKYLLVDGYFGKQKFIDGVCALGLHVIGKLRIDANLRYLYAGPRRPGPGRPQRYAGKVNLAQRSCFERLETAEEQIVLYQAVVNHVHLKRDLRVVIVVHTCTQRWMVLFSTDLAVAAMTIYRDYKARFQIEFLFREAKQFTGLTDGQARSQAKLHFHFNASLTAVSMAKLGTQYHSAQRESFSMASLKRRAFNQHLLDRIIEHLAHGATLEKSSPVYESLCNYGTLVELAA